MSTKPIPSTPSIKSISEKPFNVILLECGKSRCQHILLNTEYVGKPDKSWPGSTLQTCPKCGGDSFYTLDPVGRARRMSDNAPREIDPESIQPSEKMGLKKRRRIFAAKARALTLKAAHEAKRASH